jgi:hypothetical protein
VDENTLTKDRPCNHCGEEIPDSRAPQSRNCSVYCYRAGKRSRAYGKLTEEGKKDYWLKRNAPLKGTPTKAFFTKQSGAKKMGIGFHLTFEEWWGLWEPHWSRRDEDNLCLCRHADIGPYELGNVRIDTKRNNNLEARGLSLGEPYEKTRRIPWIMKKIPQTHLTK